jgi:hypothetical protein
MAGDQWQHYDEWKATSCGPSIGKTTGYEPLGLPLKQWQNIAQ